jgi:hypothetical protein
LTPNEPLTSQKLSVRPWNVSTSAQNARAVKLAFIDPVNRRRFSRTPKFARCRGGMFTRNGTVDPSGPESFECD